MITGSFKSADSEFVKPGKTKSGSCPGTVQCLPSAVSSGKYCKVLGCGKDENSCILGRVGKQLVKMGGPGNVLQLFCEGIDGIH